MNLVTLVDGSQEDELTVSHIMASLEKLRGKDPARFCKLADLSQEPCRRIFPVTEKDVERLLGNQEIDSSAVRHIIICAIDNGISGPLLCNPVLL